MSDDHKPDNAEEQAAIEEYKAELQALRQKDEAAFNAKMDAAKAHMVQAGYYDPNYIQPFVPGVN